MHNTRLYEEIDLQQIKEDIVFLNKIVILLTRKVDPDIVPSGLRKSEAYKVLESEGVQVDAVYLPQRIEEANEQIVSLLREQSRTRNIGGTVKSSPRKSIDAGLFKSSDTNRLTRPSLQLTQTNLAQH